MPIKYAQKSSTVQKAADTKAASVLDSSAQNESLQRKADMANNAAQRAEAPRPNNTGMPDNLKSGIESLSGFSMDDVRVHYNSSKPATVQALAYTQGTDIHVAPGQEKCLPHEAWHVAQQMAGRVSPTTNINGMPVNDNAALEHEADVMGEKAVQCKEFAKGYLTFAKVCSNDGTKQCARDHLIRKLNELLGPTVRWMETETDTSCEYQVPEGENLYKVWRNLVNEYEKNPGPKKDDKELKVTLIYKLNGTDLKSVVAFSWKNKGYIVEHMNGEKKASLDEKLGNPKRNSDEKFSGTHGTSDNWIEDALNPSNVGNAGDAVSKLIAERGRFECLENINSDSQYICLNGKYGPIYLTPEEVWSSSDSRMGHFRESVDAANRIKEIVTKDHLSKKDLDKLKDESSHFYGLVDLTKLKKNGEYNQEIVKYIYKLANAPKHSGYPYRNDEIYYAITEFPRKPSDNCSYYFSVTPNDALNPTRASSVGYNYYAPEYKYKILNYNGQNLLLSLTKGGFMIKGKSDFLNTPQLIKFAL